MDLEPIVGAVARVAGTTIGKIRKIDHEANPGIAHILIGPDREIRVPTVGLRSGLQAGWQVEYWPSEANLPPVTGTVRATRTIAGRDQALVQFFDDGRTVWLPWYRLKHVISVETRTERGEVGHHADHAERCRLRILAHAIEAWDSMTGGLGRLDIDPLPHQISLVHRILTSGEPSWLIADDVGLGKTIEVGLLLHALERQGRARRVLVICPSGLVRQWQDEMAAKFARIYEIWGRDFQVNDPAVLRLRDRVIVSMDLVKRPEPKAQLLGSHGFDVVIVDEAHRLGRDPRGGATERYALVEAIRAANLTQALLLLSGTPHQGRSDRFKALLHLLRPERQADIEMLSMRPQLVGEMVIRNRKSQVTDAHGQFIFRGHETLRVGVEAGEMSLRFRSELQQYLTRGYRVAEQPGGARRAAALVMTAYRKLASSSIAAIQSALLRRAAKLASQPDASTAAQEDDEEQLDQLAFDTSDEVFFAGEQAWLDRILVLAEKARSEDDKARVFLEKVATPIHLANKKLLIFTEYRATQEYIAEVIKTSVPSATVTMIHGGMSLDEKLHQIAVFRDEAGFMVSTEAGGEGLNLHEKCHILVNYDLPWNPSRLVQRIGRLYRYGQTERVLVFNLHGKDGFDDGLIALAVDRIETIARDLAGVSSEFNHEGLRLEIIGELLEDLDLEAILENNHGVSTRHTAEEIDAAIERAKEARSLQDEILSFAGGFDAASASSALAFDQRHVESFTEGMLEQIGAAGIRRTHNGRALTFHLPKTLHGQFSEFGRRHQVTVSADRCLVREQGHDSMVMLDLDSEFLRWLLSQARSRRFDGLHAARVGEQSTITAVQLARWQTEDGLKAGEELLAVRHDTAGATCERLSTQAFAALLLSRWTSTVPQVNGQHRQHAVRAMHAQANASLQATLRRTRNHPNDLISLATVEEVPFAEGH